MATIAENNIRAIELIVDDLMSDLNDAIDEYETALQYPEYYDVELAKKIMDERQRWYDEAKSDLESEIELAALWPLA